MTSPDSRVSKIVAALIDQTEKRNVQWSPTDDDEKFLYTGSGSSILVDTNGLLSPQPYWLKILNQRGTVIEEVAVKDADDPWSGADTLSSQVVKLYGLARRSALQIDVVLDGVLKELEDLPPW